MKLYRAYWDDGHDYGAFEYYSDYRNGSKRNLEDAMTTFHKKYGYSHKIRITSTCLV